MANTKSAQKQAKQNIVRAKRNLARSTAVRTAIKKVLVALEQTQDLEQAKLLLRDAQAKVARARGKGLFHANTASRKVSRLAKRMAALEKETSPAR